MKFVQIAVDGPVSSGKTSIMKAVAKKINFDFIDTGLMYRAFTKFALDSKIDLNNKSDILKILKNFHCEFINEDIYVNEKNFMGFVTSKEVLENINKLTVIPEVRELMVTQQFKIAQNKNCVLTGRDITSVVLPNADIKIYLDSSLETRSKRRLEQNIANNEEIQDYDVIYKMISDRDNSDKNREIGPLVKTNDSILVDNSNKTFDEVVEEILNIINSKIK